MYMTIKKFQETIWEYYKKNKRDLPWRKTRDPYKILVSEVMLQQTQVSRVVVKYKSFLKKFPTVEVLAHAKLHDVLREWQGLGYNRRAIYLKKCAETVVKDWKGKFPIDFKILCTLPGIGPATAGDIMAFSWNIPVPVIETNIRSVFIHFFFKDKEKISDKELLPIVGKALDKENPREWYWALFDYGAYLKVTSNPSRRSAHFVVQSKFDGSYRQKRAQVLRMILEKPRTENTIQSILKFKSKVLSKILLDLEKDGFVEKSKRGVYVVN
jgi:A/G-specific adenine glycosylase